MYRRVQQNHPAARTCLCQHTHRFERNAGPDGGYSLPPLLGLLVLAILLLPACGGTLEVGVVSPTEAAPPLTVTMPASEAARPTLMPTETPATPTPHIDHWTATSFPTFGIALERPADWHAVAGYGDPEIGETRFAGVNGFVHVSAMNGDRIDDAVDAEAGHHLQPYGSQPVVESIQIQGQAARLITPSDDQSAGFYRQAAVIARYPQPVQIGGRQYNFLVLWADQEHIRALAQTVRFVADVTPNEAPTPTAPITWDQLPPGLVYSTLDGLWLIDSDEQRVQIYSKPQAIPSSDGNRLLSYDAIQQDAWLIDRAKGSVLNLTHTPDRLECCFQWWPERPDLVLFGSAEIKEAQSPLEVRFYPTVVGIDGEGYQILDTEHPINISSAQGSLAPAPDGRTIAYGVGSSGWFYHHWGEGIETFYPVVYGLNVDEPYAIGQPAWSPDGTHLAWIVKEGVAEDGSSDWTGVAVFDLAARTAQILHQYESQGVGWPPTPVWSPDGQWLAFVDSSPSEYAGQWVARIDAESELHHLGPGGNPVWSPDGRWLAFQSWAREVGPPVFVALVEIGVWELYPVDIPVDRHGQLVAWVDLG
jgi:hypothetical protein